MKTNDTLGLRMKENYEKISQTKLLRRTPVAIRIDGRSFHTWTRGLKKPFDAVLINTMQDVTAYLCANIQGCVFGYTQSDEITLILQDYKELNTAAWFDYKVQKICSIAASMATAQFARAFSQNAQEECARIGADDPYRSILETKQNTNAMFDARCFNIPKEEVCNLIYWRQLDATRNSIQMVAQSLFSHSEMQGLSCNKLQDKMFTEKNVNWNDFSTFLKRGTAVIKDEEGWKIDLDMPILKGEDRQYVERYICFEGES